MTAFANTVFVYGTLKKGHLNSPILEDQEFLGKAVSVKKQFLLYEDDTTGSYPFPAMVTRENGSYVYGELYKVSDHCLTYLDTLEGVKAKDPLYSRCTDKFRALNNEVHEAFCYIYERSVSSFKCCQSCWPLRDIIHWDAAGKKIKVNQKDVLERGFRLWDKDQQQWQSPAFLHEEQLQRWAMDRSQVLGGDGQKTLWHPNRFEPRADNITCYRELLQIWDTEQNTAISPEFPTMLELCSWAATYTTLFNGESASEKRWMQIFQSLKS